MSTHHKHKMSFDLAGLFPGVLLFIGWILGPVITIFASLAIKDVLLSPSLDRVNQQRTEIRNWPHVKGLLDEVCILAVTTHGKYSHDFCNVAVVYKYEVNGQKYIKNPGMRINDGRLDWASFISHDALRRDDQGDDDNSYHTEAGGFKSAYQNCRSKLSVFLKPDDKEHVERIGKDEVIHRFFPHRQVDVYFSPSDPANSTLDNKLDKLSWWTYFGTQLVGPGIGLFIGLILCLADLGWLYIFFVLKEPVDPKDVPAIKHGGNQLQHSAHDKYAHSTDEIVKIKAEDQWQTEKPHDTPQ